MSHGIKNITVWVGCLCSMICFSQKIWAAELVEPIQGPSITYKDGAAPLVPESSSSNSSNTEHHHFYSPSAKKYYSTPISSSQTQWFIRPFVTVTGGYMMTAGAGKSMNFSIGYFNYVYDAIHQNQGAGLFGAEVGAEAVIHPALSLQVGFGYYQNTTFTARGHLIQGVNLDSNDTYHYQYSIASQQFLLEGKLLFNYWKAYHPYISINLGETYQTAYHYKTTVPQFIAFTPEYSNHSMFAPNFGAGVGVDKDITPHARIGLGYRFTDLGRVYLGNGMLDTYPVNTSLKQTDLYTNSFIVQFTYLV